MDENPDPQAPVIIEPEIDKPAKQQPNRIDGSIALKKRLQGYTDSDIARYFNVTPSAVYQHLKPFTVFNKPGNDIRVFRDNEASILDATRYKLLALANDPRKLKEMSPYQAMGMYGIAFDKMRLLTGESTANVNQLSLIIQGSEKLHKKGFEESVIPDIKQDDI